MRERKRETERAGKERGVNEIDRRWEGREGHYS